MRQRLFVGACVTLLTLLAVSGSSALDGPVIVGLTERHGLHVGDVFIFALGGTALSVLASMRDYG